MLPLLSSGSRPKVSGEFNTVIVKPIGKVDMRFAKEKQQLTESHPTDDVSVGRPGIQRALKELETDIAGWQAELEQLRAKITKARKAHEMLRSIHTPDGDDGRGDDEFAPRRRERKQSEAWKIRQGAYRAILRAGRPLSPAEILLSLKNDGVIIDGSKPTNKVYRALWDAKGEFVRTDAGFLLANEPADASVPRAPGEANK
jgi:hypothetical protein